MKHRFTTTIEQNLIDSIKHQAIKEHRSVANIIEELLRRYLNQKARS